jgi:hypothetical protein
MPFSCSSESYTSSSTVQFFLCAEMARLGFSEAIKDDVQHVMTGEIGSYLYMAPEVSQNEPYSEKVDIFSLAIVMFEMFAMIRISAIAATQGDGLLYAGWVASGNREPLPNHWPQPLKACLLIFLLANVYCYIPLCVHPWIILAILVLACFCAFRAQFAFSAFCLYVLLIVVMFAELFFSSRVPDILCA